MEEAGVIAVVKQLSSFMSDIKQMNSAIDGLRPSGTLLGSMFEFLGSTIQSFGQAVWDVASVTLGVLLRDAIEFIIGKLGDLINATIEAGNTFQLLQIRLTGLNLNDVSDGVKTYNEAMGEATKLTKEQLQWLQTFGVASPFDPAMIANVYTLARSYGFADTEAKRLTEDTLNYTAGMGLSNETLELVIRNMGQMVQRGKITSTELRDLARGSYMPLSDLMERIAKNMGITVEELSKQIVTPKGVPAEQFILAFEQMVEEEPRFVGAAGRLARALIPATNNVKELITSIFGLNVVAPVFDVLGNYVAGFVDQFVFFNEQGDLVKTEKWDALVTAAKNLGSAISYVVSNILGFMPTSESLANNLIAGVQGLADWIDEHRSLIVEFFQGIGETIQNEVIPFVRDQLLPTLGSIVQWVWDHREDIMNFFSGIGKVITETIVPFIRDQLMPAFQQISDWVTTNKPTIDQFFQTIGQIFGEFLGDVTGGPKPGGEQKGPLATLLDGIKSFMDFVNNNPETITKLVEVLWTLFIVSQVLAVVFSIVATVFGFFLSLALMAIGVLTTVALVIALMSSPIFLTVAAIILLGAFIAWIAIYAATHWEDIKKGATNLWNGLVEIFTNLWNDMVKLATRIWEDLKKSFTKLWENIKAIDWGGLGRSIIDGIAAGITSAWGTLREAAVNAAKQAYDAAVNFLQSGSPSKLFMELGEWTMIGFAKGIEGYAGIVASSMTDAMQTVAAPAMIMPTLAASLASGGGSVSHNSEQNNNFNLAIHSSANTEPIISDFNMMKSLVGG